VRTKVLIVEDQFIEAHNLKRILEKAGYDVPAIARSVPAALGIIEKDRPDLVLLDIYLQGEQTGIDLAHILREKSLAFVFLSANSSRQILDAAKATQPYGFLLKPFREKDILIMLDVANYLHLQKKEIAKFKNVSKSGNEPLPMTDQLKEIVGKSKAMQLVLEKITMVYHSHASVLLLGESGTGKELAAKAIHSLSARSKGPMVVINCGALPANLIESELFGHEKGAFTGALAKKTGKFERADGGTIFLDEIGELPPDLQVRFLRVLQEREIESIGGQPKKIDVRVIAATNKNLEEEVAAGRFRLDLYYRLNVFPIEMPPLRERKEDILLLAEHFLRVYATEEGKTVTGYTKEVADRLVNYAWPGNVRELQNVIARSVLSARSTVIDTLLLPANAKNGLLAGEVRATKTMEENERDHIIHALIQCDWRISGKGGAAELLAINASTLNSRIKKLRIERKISPK
jgi:DNA-binding NtrC family response regulator